MHGFSGAKGGSGGSSSFKQRPDTLRSTDTFEGLLGLCAGPIKGLTRGLKSLKIDGTPLEDESGKLNFENFLAILADGDPTSFPQEVDLRLGAGGSPVAVNLALSNTNSSGPGPWVTKSIANTGADFLDFRFLVNQLYRQDKTGIFEHTANIEIQLKPTGTTNWISPMLGTPSQTYSQSGIPSSLPGQRVYIPRTNYDPSGNYKPETNLGYFKITGKTTSVAVHELRITVPNTDAYENVGWDVRARLIEKESVDADPNFEKRTITWESVSAGYNTKLGVTEPWRGLAWLQVYGKASDQLTGVPTVEGEYDTLIVPVPPAGVFDPETRAYTTAIWDGSWARSFTTDPAWNINGLLSDALHGMASVSPGAHLNKWDALEASKWFSEMVPDGNGGTEPRYSLNIAINEPQKAAEFVPYLAGAVGALAWEENAGEWRIKADKPENPSDLFTLEAIEGEFRYSHTNVDTRFNDITVVFLNKEFGYREDRVRVVDSAHIARFGRKPTTIVAIGCTGRQEALRRAIMRLRVSTRETRMVNFTTNRRGRLVRPLSTILIADGDLGTLIDSDENTRSTGRIISVAPDRMSVTVRDPLRLELGVDYDVTFTLPNPDYAPDADVDPQGEDFTLPTITQTVALTNTAAQRGNVTTLHLASALPANVAPNANLALQATNLPALPKQYRVTHVEPDGERVAISAIEIDTGKWDASDSGVAEEGYVPPSNVVVPPVLNAVISTGSFESDYGTNLTLNVNWERPAGSMIAGYRTEYRVNGADWVRINSRTSLTSIEIVNPQFGKWDFRITTLDRAGRTSEPVVVSIVVDENLKPGYYADGTPIDDLRPAEPGATAGAPAGTPVNDRTAEQITAQIDAAHQKADDLIATYGSTASAAASADAAEQFKILAEAAKNDAEAAEVQSLNSANNSQGSADASAQSAALADTKAGEAGASATAAEGFMLSARRSAAKVLPSQVGNWDDFVVHTGGSFGAPVEDSPSPDWGSTVTAAGEGEVREFVGTRYIFATRGKLPRGTNRKFKVTARFRTTVDANPNGIYLGFFQYNEDDSYNTTTNWSYKGQSNSADGWTEITATIESAEFSSPYIRAGMATNSANGTGSSGATMQVASLRFEDITESDRAASSATAAQASAVSADADAALASQQAGLAATHKNESEAAATAASGSAASANADAAAAATNAEISAAYSATRGLTPNGDLSQGNTGWDGGAGEPDGAGPAATFTPVASWNGATNVLVNSSNTRKNIRARAHQVLPDRKYRVHWRYRVTATCGNYVYIRGYDAAGTYITTFQAHGTASPPLNTWIEGSYDFDSGDLAGWAMFAISFNSNTANLAATVGVDYLYLEDITESATASSFADIAESQQVIATAAAAAAETNAQLSAQLASQGYFGNANFAQWPGGINSIPDGFVHWAGSYTIERRSGGRYGSPSYMLMNGGSGTTSTGIRRIVNTGQYNQPFGPNQWVVIEVDARLRGGDLRGSGILFRSGSSTNIDGKLDLYTDPDTTGATGNGISSQGLRSWRKLVQMPGYDANNTNINLYIMNKWSGFASSTTSSAETSIDWYYVNVRPASDGEIKAQQVDGLSATVTQHATALATHDVQLASLDSTVQAQGVTVSQHTTAINNVEDDVSNMAGRWGVAIDVNGRVVGRVRLDGTAQQSTFDVDVDNFRVTGGNGARTEFSDGNWRIYDSSNVMRVRLGVWAV